MVSNFIELPPPPPPPPLKEVYLSSWRHALRAISDPFRALIGLEILSCLKLIFSQVKRCLQGSCHVLRGSGLCV